MNGETVIRMIPFTASANADYLTDSLFGIFGSSGTVLVYSGSDPTDWVQVGAWRMPAPVSNMAFVEVDGDIFIATKEYAYWVRDLMAGGASYAYENSPSRTIQNLWQSVGYDSSLSNALVSHAFYPRS